MQMDDALITRAMTGPQDRLSKEDRDNLMEFLWRVRSGGSLSGRERATLHEIAGRIGIQRVAAH